MTPAVLGAADQNYRGEQGLLLFHRYFLYLALIFVVILGYDAVKAFFLTMVLASVGSLVLTINVLLLAGFTFGCNLGIWSGAIATVFRVSHGNAMTPGSS